MPGTLDAWDWTDWPASLASYIQTSAHSLAYACILLALYPDEQEKFYQNIKSVLPTDRAPVRAPHPSRAGLLC